MSDSETLRRLRAGMNAMFDAAAKDIEGKALLVSQHGDVDRESIISGIPADYNVKMLDPETAGRPMHELSLRNQAVFGSARLDEDPDPKSGYARSDETFTDEEIAFMTGSGS